MGCEIISKYSKNPRSFDPGEHKVIYRNIQQTPRSRKQAAALPCCLMHYANDVILSAKDTARPSSGRFPDLGEYVAARLPIHSGTYSTH